MSDDRSPWARPEPGHETAGHVTPGGSSAYSQNPQPARGTALDDRPAGYRAGTVTRLEQRPKQDVLEQGRELTEELARRNRLMLRWFGGGAAVVVIVGLVVLLAMVTGHAGNDGPFGRRAAPPPDTRPQLAQLCPPPSVDPGHEKVEPPPPPPGPRTVDPPAGVTKFRLHFKQAGLMATDELVGLALIDVGRPNAAIIYISVPGTHRQFDYVVDQVLDSVRPT